ncbi:hypothetical protein MUY27_03055 [Mucilaginibacter sp. RS28]|uniref:Uncharacterized protein n=1 Tax=Mucilaginibacter straminoryzae TaxID=2932774 RepID=A0A9X1X1N7_9SPHI|nr:hypothetical protein [Mucilaginibacter straminoryzae]MCJ8208670.1 hypothetical protein [Mucilaginibacter straminoryzae]
MIFRINKLDAKVVPESPGKYHVDYNVYLEVYDDNNQPTDGNYVSVFVRQDSSNGQSETVEYNIPGQRLLLFSGTVDQVSQNGITELLTFTVVNYTVPSSPAPVYGDVRINAVNIDQKASAANATDARITINAFATYGPVQYSVDALAYQSSATFSGLSGGVHTAYAKDATDAVASLPFTIPTVRSLLIADPSVTLPGGNISRWNAAFNPIVFTYQRKDFEVINIQNGPQSGGTTFSINGVVSKIKKGDQVYVNAGAYNGIYNVLDASGSQLTLDVPYIVGTGTTGFMNSNTLRSYYKVTTRVIYQDKETGLMKSINSENRPDAKGVIRADLSSFLQSLLFAADNSNYTLTNYRDTNLSASYQVAYQESWVDENQQEQKADEITIAEPYYITYSARQLGSKYGGNMAVYIPFKTVASPDFRAQWVTDFAEPAFSPGYPFDIGFIYSEDLVGLNLYYELTMLDANRNPLSDGILTSYLLNDNNSFLLQQDGGKFIIRQTATNTTGVLLPNQLGLNRLLIQPDLPPEASYLSIVLKYRDTDNNPVPVTQTQTIRVDDAVEDNSIYLRWIGLSGSWNYYRFVYNQEVSLDVQNAVIVKKFVTDWENQEGIEEVISKNAGSKIKLMAEDLSIADIKGLQSIKYSPKVQMLLSSNPVKWQTVVINTATYTEYETRYGRYQFSVVFNQPSLNIQTQ